MPRKNYRFGHGKKLRCKQLETARKENISTTTSDQNNTNVSNDEAVDIVDYEQNISDSNVNDADDINSSNNNNDINNNNNKDNSNNNNDKPTTPISASKRKLQDYRQILVDLGLESYEDEDQNSEPEAGFIFIQKSVLCQLVKNLKCPECDLEELTVQISDKNLGLVVYLYTQCTSCGCIVNSTHTSKRLANETSSRAAFILTRTLVFATLDMGVGFAGLDRLTRLMGMTSISQKTYISHLQEITTASKQVSEGYLAQAGCTIRKIYFDLDPEINIQGFMDLTVTFDASWLTRGHSSLYCVAFAIEVITGLVLDFHVVSAFCHSCSYAKNRLGGDTDEFRNWFESHKHECNVNFHGSSNAMEAEAARVIWSRSLESGFRYVSLISDGDSKTFDKLKELNIYGDEHPINKQECINHVSKRMGTALRKLTKDSKKVGVTLGGRGHGRLTQNVINKLTLYYGKAIRDNSNDLNGMRNAVFASFLHAISNDDTPHHSRCPSGEASWCFYQKALALGETPGSHSVMVGTPLNMEVAKEVEPIYSRLGSEGLLRRCLAGKTQNANESLHNKVWHKCPKTNFYSYQRICLAAATAAAEFNKGLKVQEKLLSIMGIPIGEKTISSRKKLDIQRINLAQKRASDSTKEARLLKKTKKTQALAALELNEGTTYSAGSF